MLNECALVLSQCYTCSSFTLSLRNSKINKSYSTSRETVVWPILWRSYLPPPVVPWCLPFSPGSRLVPHEVMQAVMYDLDLRLKLPTPFVRLIVSLVNCEI